MLGLKKRTWIAGGVAATMLATAAYAHSWRDTTPAERAEYATERMADRMDLNEAQTTALRQVVDTAMEIRSERTDFMLMLSSELKNLAADDTLTVEEVNALKEQIKAELDKRADEIVPEFVAFYNTLDDEQRQQVVARIEKMSERIASGEHRRGERHGRRGE